MSLKRTHTHASIMGNAPDQFQPVCFTSDLICFQLKKKRIRFKARFFVIIAVLKASFFTTNFLGNDYKK
tara:strand:+ start:426 stop:632 length:207 start_codon:yes stop_codon:yes gene_type:complete